MKSEFLYQFMMIGGFVAVVYGAWLVAAPMAYMIAGALAIGLARGVSDATSNANSEVGN